MWKSAKTILFFVVLIAIVIINKEQIKDVAESMRLRFSLSSAPSFKEKLAVVAEDLSLNPEPLIGKVSSGTVRILSADKVIELTNKERGDNSLSGLVKNSKLESGALSKAYDMLRKQYFAHESPTGVGPGEIAKNAGYDFVSVGENLALGVFKDEGDLVKAWMDSPGHRDNILNKKWSEIGVAVIKGEYEGKIQIIAVQEFGTPGMACKKPLEVEKKYIESRTKELAELRGLLEETRGAILRDSTRSKVTIDEYNVAIKSYNTLVAELEAKTKSYNNSAGEFNACLAKLGK